MAKKPARGSGAPAVNVGNTLLSASNIILVGFNLVDLKLQHNPSNDPPTRDNANDFLGKMLTTSAGPRKNLTPQFARIFGFIASGAYVDLEAPTIFLVHGEGTPIEDLAGQALGLTAQSFHFAHHGTPNEAKGWAYDESDFSMTLDVSSGPIADLIESGMGDVHVAGSRVSGSRVSGSRVSGSRVSGSRVSGSRVSGSRVSGSRVSGSRVSGSRVSGVDD